MIAVPFGEQSMKVPLFKPWVGKKYGYRSCFGIPVMVLGESHYDWKGRVIPASRVTVEIIREEISGEFKGKKRRFYANIVAAFLGAKPEQEQRAAFWNSVLREAVATAQTSVKWNSSGSAMLRRAAPTNPAHAGTGDSEIR